MTDIVEKKLLAEDARDILESQAFKAAQAQLKERLLNTLLGGQLTDERKLEIIAEMKVIEEIGGQLRVLINDYNAGVRALGRARPPHG